MKARSASGECISLFTVTLDLTVYQLPAVHANTGSDIEADVTASGFAVLTMFLCPPFFTFRTDQTPIGVTLRAIFCCHTLYLASLECAHRLQCANA